MPAPARIKLRDLTELLEWDPDLILLAENQAGMAYKIKGSLIPGSGGGGSSGDPSSYDIINAIPVANQAARLALTPDEARNALVRESDTGISYMLVAGGDPAFLADWLKVSDITPAIEDVVGLTTALSSIGTQLGTKERAVAQALADAGTIQWNMANGNIAIVTIGGNRNLANPTNVTAGRYTLKVKQDGTGNRNLNFAGNYVFPNGPLALSTAPNQETVIQFVAPGDGKLYHEGIPRIGSYNLTKLQKEQSAININAVQWNQIQLSEYTSPFPSPGHAYYNLDRPFQYVTTATYEDDHVELRLDVGCAAVILNDTSWGGNNVLVRGGGNELLVTIPKGRTGFAWYGEESGGMGGFLFPESDGEGIVLDTRDPVDSTPGEPQQQVGLATFSEGPVNGAGNIDIVVTDAVMDTGPLSFTVEVDEPLEDLAGRVRALFEATAAITARYAVGGSGAEVTLTRLVAAPNDPTLAVDFDWLDEAGVAISFATVTPGQDTLWRTMVVTGLDPEHGMNGRYVETAELSEGYPVFQRSPGRKIRRDSGYWVISRDIVAPGMGSSWYSPGSHNATHPGGHDDFEPLGGLATGTATVTGRAPDEAEPGTRWINTHDARAWTQAGETTTWVEDLRPLVEDEIARLSFVTLGHGSLLNYVMAWETDIPFMSSEENVFGGQLRGPNQTAAQADSYMTRALVQTEIDTTNIVTESTTSRSLTLADARACYIRCTHASGCAITVPLNSAQAFPVGTAIHFRRAGGAGAITLAGSATVNNAAAVAAVLEHDNFSLVKVATDTWDFI